MQRRTRQRDGILEALQASGTPLSVEEIFKHAKKTTPGLGIATVYRTVKALLRQKQIITVELPGTGPRYEVAGKLHHHHFECDGCGRVYEIEGCLKDIDRLTPPGMRVKRHELVLYGTCRSCAG